MSNELSSWVLRTWSHIDHLHFWNLEAFVNILGSLQNHALHDVVGVALSLHFKQFSLVGDALLKIHILLKELDLFCFQLGFLEFLLLCLFLDLDIKTEDLSLVVVLNLLLLQLVGELIFTNVFSVFSLFLFYLKFDFLELYFSPLFLDGE